MRSGRSDRAAPPHRLRVPERRAVSAYERRRQYRHHAKAARRAGGGDCRAGRRTARPGAARPRAVPRPPAARTLRRPAPARRRRAGARGKAAHRADGRAVRRARSPTRDALGDDYRALHRQARADHGHDHPRHDRGDPARRPHRGDARRTGCWRRARRPNSPTATTPMSANCCARRGGRPSGSRRCCRGTARHELVLRSALERGAGASAGLSRQPCAGQRHRAGARARRQPAAGDRRAQPAGCCAARCSGLPASCRRCRAWRCWRCSIRCCWRWRRCRWRGSASAFPRSASCPRCWRWRSIRCCRCCATPSPACTASIPRSSRPRRASA